MAQILLNGVRGNRNGASIGLYRLETSGEPIMFKRKLLCASLLLGVASAAHADAFLFDMDGGAGDGSSIITATSFDWNVGSALAIAGNPAGGLTAGNEVTLLYQANLSLVNAVGGPRLNGTFGTYFTAVAGFQETVSSVVVNPNGTVTANFTADAGDLAAPSFFYIYANTTGEADNLNGTGFTSGSIILSAVLSSVNSAFTVTSFAGEDFDQFDDGSAPVDDWNGQQTVTGNGSTQIGAKVMSFDSSYFLDPDFLNAIISTAFNTSLINPFLEVNPSYCFSNDGTTDCNQVVFDPLLLTSTLGPMNGSPFADPLNTYDFQFQADGTSSLTLQAIPEPGSLALLGLGLGALSLIRRREKRNSN